MNHFQTELDRAAHLRKWCDDRTAEWDSSTRIAAPAFHYTNMQGLKGIISTQEFWLTEISRLNDTGELKFGLNFAIDLLKAYPLARSNRFIRVYCDEMVKVLESGLDYLFEFFVASFTPLRDVHSQWVTYGGDNGDGAGFAIGLAPSIFHTVPTGPVQPGSPLLAMPMIYDRDVVVSRLRDTINLTTGWLLPTAKNFTTAGIPALRPFLTDYSAEVSKELLLEAFRAKHDGWQSEAEIRLSTIVRRATGSHLVRTRQRGGETVRYVAEKLPLQGGGITEIIAGPRVTSDAFKEIQVHLEANGFPRDLLKKSTLPLSR